MAHYSFGQQEWMNAYKSGKLLPVRANFAPACAESAESCAFDAQDPGTIYLTKITSNWGAPAGYQIGPKPSSWSYIGPPPTPWPGKDVPNTGPIITPEEDLKILQQTLELPKPEPSFLTRNFKPIVAGGSAMALGIMGLILLAVDI